MYKGIVSLKSAFDGSPNSGVSYTGIFERREVKLAVVPSDRHVGHISKVNARDPSESLKTTPVFLATT